tara:strand:- start:622 stop:816 length:195 start_codon:yes stop_codon:yes gene_type:complete
MIQMKKNVGRLSYKGVLSWLESIHEDTVKYGSEDQQFVLEQMIDYFKNDYREGKPLVNNNTIGY